jgi:amino acid efflux transporter
MFCFIAVMLLYGTGTMSLSTLIPISERNLYSHVHGRLRCRNSAPQRQPYRRCPQLDFVCGYSRRIPFTGWAMLYPLLIALLCLGIQLRFSRRKATSLDI